MAAKSALHSSSPNTSSFLNSKSNLVHFRRTQLRFEPRIPSKPIKWESCSRTREQSREKVKQGGRLFTVRCTAEGIERGILIGGGRGREEAVASKMLDIPERFKVVALVACVMCLCNADRVVMSVTVVPLATKFGWSSSFLGIVQVNLFPEISAS
jgi:ACS family sodium-dependent inorganic phosphate cotransporter